MLVSCIQVNLFASRRDHLWQGEIFLDGINWAWNLIKIRNKFLGWKASKLLLIETLTHKTIVIRCLWWTQQLLIGGNILCSCLNSNWTLLKFKDLGLSESWLKSVGRDGLYRFSLLRGEFERLNFFFLRRVVRNLGRRCNLQRLSSTCPASSRKILIAFFQAERSHCRRGGNALRWWWRTCFTLRRSIWI
jgi:hypothetical protein